MQCVLSVPWQRQRNVTFYSDVHVTYKRRRQHWDAAREFFFLALLNSNLGCEGGNFILSSSLLISLNNSETVKAVILEFCNIQ